MVEPKNDFNCVCLIDADIKVDFAEPLDYVEEVRLLILEND